MPFWRLAELQARQILHDLRIVPVDRTHEFSLQHSVLVDDEGFRPTGSAVNSATFLFRVTDGQKIHAVLLEEAFVGGFVHINADADHRNPFALYLAAHLDEGRHFLHARATPRRPEIQDDGLSFVVVQGDRAVRILDNEIGGGGSNTGRFGPAVAGSEAEEQS